MDINTSTQDEEISIEGIENLFDEIPETDTSTIEDALSSVGEEEVEEESTAQEESQDLLEDKEDKVEVIEEKENSPKDKETNTETKSKIQELIELGILEDVRVSVSEDDEEGTLLSEQDNLTKEQIRDIINLQKQNREKKISETHIPKDNLSEHHLKIIEIMKNGGDLSKLFQDPNQAVNRPFEGKDLTDVNTQREVAMTYYTTQKGHTPKEAQALIQQKEKDFELDTFAGDIVQAYHKAYDGYLNKVKEDKVREQQEYKKTLSDRKKLLTEAFKEKGIRDNVYSSVINGVTKPLEDGSLQVHKAIEEILNNPKENYDVLLHLLDRKAYNDLYKLNTKKSSTEQVLKLFDALPKDKTNQRKEDNKGFASEIEEEIAKIKIT